MRTQMTGARALDAAVSHVATAVPVFGSSVTVGEAVRSMRGRRYECAAVVALCDEGHLGGLVPVERLLAARDDTRLVDIADPDPPVVGAGVDQEVAAWRAVQHREGTIAVVDDGGQFVGLIPPSSLLGVLLQEHDEDMARMGGYLKRSSLARNAAVEPVVRRFVHRMPWLLVGLIGAMLSVGIVSSFEARLERNVALAFFIPAVVYIADAVGTQTEALVIRALAVDVPVRRLVRREALTGLFIGIALAVAIFPYSLLYGDASVAGTVSLAMLAASSVATVLAMVLPWLLNRLGRDPAFGSGPVATITQDLVSILLYFVIATALVA
ncbi:MAG: magnesium transporter [Nocardioidaceae bacterium]